MKKISDIVSAYPIENLVVDSKIEINIKQYIEAIVIYLYVKLLFLY